MLSKISVKKPMTVLVAVVLVLVLGIVSFFQDDARPFTEYGLSLCRYHDHLRRSDARGG